MIMFVGILLLVGCGKEDGLTENPTTNATVVSNGSSIVQKADYVYFVNGYIASKDLTNAKTDNVFGKTTTGAIYRVKLVNGNIPMDADGKVAGAEIVVPKVVGFENGGFYIFGDYIYYATPNMGSDSAGNLLNTTVNFCRININGSEDTNKVMAEAVNLGESGVWKAYYIDGSVYFVTYANSTLTSIKVGEKKGESVTIATDVTSATLPDSNIYSPTNRENDPEYEGKDQLESYNQWIYYTKAQPEDSTKKGNVLLKAKVGSDSATTLEETNVIYTVKEQKNGYLFYTKENGLVTDSPAILYKVDIANNFINETKACNAEYENIWVIQGGTTTATIIYTDSLLKATIDGGTTYRGLVSDAITVTGISGNHVYYYHTENKTFNRVNAFDGTITVLYSEDDDNALAFNGSLKFDVLANKIVTFVADENGIKTLCIDTSGSIVKTYKIEI